MANINPQQKKNQIFTKKKLVLANTFLRKFYFVIIKIKLSQKLYTTRYLSIEFNTEFKGTYYPAGFQQQQG